MRSFYGPIPPGTTNEVEIWHNLGTTQLIAVSVWYLPLNGYSEGILRQLVTAGVAVTGPDTVRVIFADELAPTDGVRYEIGVLAHD